MRGGAIFRIAMWATAGFLVAVGWGIYFATKDKGISIEPIVYDLARLTQPAAALVLYLNPRSTLGLTTVVLGNAAMYALVGFIVEAIRRPLQTSN